MIRVIEGHTISMINDLPLAHIITRDDLERMPALCHGTGQDAVPSIVYSVLRPMGRNNVMFSVFPHFDERIGVGQRSGYNQSDAIVFLDKRTVGCGCSRRKIPPLIVYLMGKAGTLSIPTIVTTNYIEKVVFRIGRGWSSILTRTLISRFQ